MTEAEQREIAVYVAERVMRWEHIGATDSILSQESNGGYIYDGQPTRIVRGVHTSPWGPFTSAADDYAVLERVREAWEFGRVNSGRGFMFNAQLSCIWGERGKGSGTGAWTWCLYRPGDYATAAYRVLRQSIQDFADGKTG